MTLALAAQLWAERRLYKKRAHMRGSHFVPSQAHVGSRAGPSPNPRASCAPLQSSREGGQSAGGREEGSGKARLAYTQAWGGAAP